MSNIGVALVLDSLYNLRMYDLYHGEKIARMTLTSLLSDSLPVRYKIEPSVIMNGSRD